MTRQGQNSPEQFREQLNSGHYNELRVALWLMLRGHFVHIGFDGARFDVSFLHKERRHKVEVKWDKRAGETGRLYFEHLNTRQGQQSGVASTDAHWWCQVLGEGQRALMMPVPWLRGWLQDGTFREVNTRGADSNSRGFLVPLGRLLQEKQARKISLPSLDGYFGLLVERALRQRGGLSLPKPAASH